MPYRAQTSLRRHAVEMRAASDADTSEESGIEPGRLSMRVFLSDIFARMHEFRAANTFATPADHKSRLPIA